MSQENVELTATDVKVFVPAKDYQQSLAFYKRLGWKVLADHDGGLAELELANVRLFLQNYYQKHWANNFMIYINVTDVQAWYQHVQQIIASGDFPKVRVKEPEQQSYGDRVCFVWDPSGVLLHIAQAEKV